MSRHAGEIGDDEVLFRRIPASQNWCQWTPGLVILADAFYPHRTSDVDGLSMSRAQSDEHPDFLTPEELAATGPSRQGYFVAELQLGELRKIGLTVVADPLDGNPGHVLIPEIHSGNRRTPEVENWANQLAANLVHKATGPHPGNPPA